MSTKRAPVASLIGACFGSLWAVAGSLAFSGTVRSMLLIVAGLITAVVLLRIVRRSKVANGSETRMFRRLPYLIAVLLEALAIATLVALLPRYGYERSLLQAIGIIVGLHFIGLWKATQATRFVWIAAGMCFVSILAIYVQHSASGTHAGDALTGLGDAFILWFGASVLK